MFAQETPDSPLPVYLKQPANFIPAAHFQRALDDQVSAGAQVERIQVIFLEIRLKRRRDGYSLAGHVPIVSMKNGIFQKQTCPKSCRPALAAPGLSMSVLDFTRHNHPSVYHL
jgi:hypothetical protein